MKVALKSLMLTLAVLVCLACARAEPKLSLEDKLDARRVLVVINADSTDSQEVGAYYRQKRQIPKENVVLVHSTASDNVPVKEYEEKIERVVRDGVKHCGHHIDFIVLTKGVPLRIGDDGGCSVDAFLAAMNLGLSPIAAPNEEAIQKNINPYFGKDEPFDSEKYHGQYLVTRLDAPTVGLAKRLVDLSLSARPEKGLFFFDQAGNRRDAGYGQLDRTLAIAAKALQGAGFQATLEATEAFVAPPEALMGYCSWGSNDAKFDKQTYRKLRFKPGAIAETFVSTSGRTFALVEGGQSQIADLIAQGVTGVKGYVSEPYTFALARPDILFPRYTHGRNLAESFAMASLVLKWKDVVVGDPLCRPYQASPRGEE